MIILIPRATALIGSEGYPCLLSSHFRGTILFGVSQVGRSISHPRSQMHNLPKLQSSIIDGLEQRPLTLTNLNLGFQHGRQQISISVANSLPALPPQSVEDMSCFGHNRM